MYKSIFILLILAFTSCLNDVSCDLERMNLFGEINSIIEEKRDSNDVILTIKEIEFNSSGFVKTTVFYNPETQITNRTINRYDYRDRLTKQEFLMNDSLMLTQQYIQINSNKDSLIGYDSSGNLTNTGVIVYNNKKQVEKLYGYDLTQNLIHSEISKYDAMNRVIETRIESFESSSNVSVFIYNYDSLGRVKTFTLAKSNDKIMSKEKYSYETDEKKNWIRKKVLSSDNQLLAVVTRKIKYK